MVNKTTKKLTADPQVISLDLSVLVNVPIISFEPGLAAYNIKPLKSPPEIVTDAVDLPVFDAVIWYGDGVVCALWSSCFGAVAEHFGAPVGYDLIEPIMMANNIPMVVNILMNFFMFAFCFSITIYG